MSNTLRACIVAQEGYTYISADASQIELRDLAILSQDPKMLEDLKSGDLHMATAIRMLGLVTLEDAKTHLGNEATQEELEAWVKDTMKRRRYIAKQANFALVYGADERKLAEMLEVPEDEAADFMAEHRKTYPTLYKWMVAMKKKAKEDGFVISPFGRIRPLPDLLSDNWKFREKAEREIINTIVQGHAVDIVKKMMLMMRRCLSSITRLVLQVHDEMVWEVPDSIFEEQLQLFRILKVAFPDYPVSLKVGKCYGELEDYKFEA
jgi:DNA polymerase I